MFPGKWPVKSSHNFVFHRALGDVASANCLHFLAHFHTAAAFYTFGHITNNNTVRIFDRNLFRLIFKQRLAATEVTS
jgi:hypothetical protein